MAAPPAEAALPALAALLALPALAANPADPAPRPGVASATLDRIADFVQGRLISQGGVIYHAGRVRGRLDAEGQAELVLDVDPLFEIDLVPGADGLGHGVALPADAACGLAGLPTRLSGTNFSVRQGQGFVDLSVALAAIGLAWPDAGNRPVKIAGPDLARLRACAKVMAARADALPFESIRVEAGDERIVEIGRTTTAATLVERELGDERVLTRLTIEPKPGHTGPFSVDVQSISAMQCDYEGPHIELDGWKEGASEARPLRRSGKGPVFAIDPTQLDATPPPFPAYTQTELRAAINQHRGSPGLSTIEEATPCGPILRGYRFTVSYQSTVVQTLSVYWPGGC